MSVRRQSEEMDWHQCDSENAHHTYPPSKKPQKPITIRFPGTKEEFLAKREEDKRSRATARFEATKDKNVVDSDGLQTRFHCVIL